MASRLSLRLIRNANTVINKNLISQNVLKSLKLSPINNAYMCLSNRAFSTSIFRATNVLKDLSNFLNEEIKLETESRKSRNDLPKVSGFDLKTDGPNVTLTKKFNDEEVTVKLNVNGSLDNSEPNIEQAVEEKGEQAGTEVSCSNEN